jgi:hypothetical protein
MHTQVQGSKMKRWAGIIVTLLSVLGVLIPVAQAADEYNTGRIVQHVQKVETMDVGDVPGHTMGVSIHTGLVIYSKTEKNWEIASTMSVSEFELVNGKGTATNRRVVTFQDGSTMLIKAAGTVTIVEGGKKTVFEGTYECKGGTGRFAGWKGTGTYRGERIGTIKAGSDSYIDFSDNCKKQ